MSARACVAILVVAAAAAVTPAPASAQDEPLEWSDDWSRTHPASYVASTVAFAGTLFFEHYFNPGAEALFRGPQLFDAHWRVRLMAPDLADRDRAATLSDVLLMALLAWPVVDAGLVAGLGHGSSDVFWQLTSIAIEAAAADYVLSVILKVLIHRERPHGARCTLEDRLRHPDRCGREGRTRSFYSGHASAAFSSAGVVCMAHAHLPLYGSEAADWMGCGAAMLTASVVGVLRVVADRHHASDVLLGAAFGLLTGLGLPYLLHYGWDPTPEDDVGMEAAPLTRGTTPVMLSWGGAF